MMNFNTKQKVVSHSEQERVMMDQFYGPEYTLDPTKNTHVTFDKVPLLSTIDQISELGFDVYQNDITGAHWIHDADNKCLVNIHLGSEGRNENTFSEFVQKSFAYGFAGNADTVNFIINELQLTDGGQI